MSELKIFIAKIARGGILSHEESRAAFQALMSGEATQAQIGGFLMALRVRGETPEELCAAVEILREKMIPVSAPADAIDIVGTGGDALGSYNISTCAAFIAAGMGLTIAKHGSRALSSQSGSADVLTALGVNINLTPTQITNCITQAGIGFMFAPTHHTAMKHIASARRELGTYSLFNLIGPLANPARVKRQVTGVFSSAWLKHCAEVLQKLGTTACWICHGEGGYDELVPTGKNQVVELKDGSIREFNFIPEDIGLKHRHTDELKGGNAAYNASALRAVLMGERNGFRDAAVMNAGAAFVVTGKTLDLASAIKEAEKSIDDGSALSCLKKLIEASHATD